MHCHGNTDHNYSTMLLLFGEQPAKLYTNNSKICGVLDPINTCSWLSVDVVEPLYKDAPEMGTPPLIRIQCTVPAT